MQEVERHPAAPDGGAALDDERAAGDFRERHSALIEVPIGDFSYSDDAHTCCNRLYVENDVPWDIWTHKPSS